MPFRQNAAFRGFQSAVLRLALLAFQGVSVTAQPVSSATAPELGSSQSSRPHPIMHPDFATREQWRANHRTLPHAAISAAVQHRLTASAQASLPTSTNLLPYMTFTPSAWDQGNCGSCWTFASTAMLEVAMAYNYGIKDQLSVQFFQDNTNSYSCLGGDLTMFTTWYNKAGILVPLSNAGAGYVDGATNQYCLGPLDNANNLLPSSKPNYPITLVTPAKIDNTTLNQSQMITAMKAAINQGQAIGFSFFTDFGDSGGFYDFWDNKPETALWTNPFDNATYNAASWGGHMVAIMGYDDSDPNPANNYWIVQNQWGVSTNRPNGQFRMPMTMDYAARLTDGVNTYFAYTFETLTLTMTPAAPAAPTVFVGAAPTGISQGQPLSTSAVVGQQLMMAAWVTGPPPFRYQWRKDGVAIPGATSGLYTIPYVNTTDGGHQYDVIATNASGSATAAAVSFVVNGQQLLLNPGFESGGSGAWTWSSTLPTAETNPFRTDPTSSYSHSGTWYSFLGYDDSIGTKNTGYLEQLVTIPAGAGTVTLSYWVQQITSQSDYTTIDTLTMHVTDAQGNILKTLNTYKTQDWDHILWTQDSFDLSDFRGQTVMVRADWSEKATNMTAWRLDDFALTFNPVITPTPTLFPKAATVAWGGSQAFTPIVANGTANTVTWSAGGTVPTGIPGVN